MVSIDAHTHIGLALYQAKDQLCNCSSTYTDRPSLTKLRINHGNHNFSGSKQPAKHEDGVGASVR